MKRALLALPVLIVSLIAVALIAPSFIDWNGYKPQIQEQAKIHTGLDVSLKGDIALSLFPYPRVMLSDVGVSRSMASDERTEIIGFERLDVHVDFIPLLQGKLEFNSISLIRPKIDIKMNETGEFNFMTPELASAGGAPSGNSEPDIAIKRAYIKEGIFSYTDSAGNITRIDSMDIEIKAQSLRGPFNISGAFSYQNRRISAQIDSHIVDENLSAKLRLGIEPENIAIEFSGAIALGDSIKAQGEASLIIPDLSKIDAMAANASARGQELSVSGLLTADSDQIELSNALIKIGADEIQGSLGYSIGKSIGAVHIKSGSEGIAIEPFAPAVAGLGKAVFDLRLTADQNKILLQPSKIAIGGKDYDLSAQYAFPENEHSRASITAKVTAPDIDMDALASKLPQSRGSKANAGATEAIGQLNLPFDLDLEINAKKVITNGMSFEGITSAAVFRANSFELKSLRIGNLSGASVTASAKIADTKNAAGIDASFSLETKDFKSFASLIGMNPDNLPQNISAASIKAKYDGDASKGNATVNISALGGDIIAQGVLKNALAAPVLENIALQVKHPNTAQAIRNFSGAEFNDPNFTRALDFYTTLQQDGNTYTLGDVKADISGVSMQGSAKIRNDSKPYISGDFTLGNLAIGSSAPSGNRSQSGAKSSQTISGRWSSEEINTSMLHTFNMDIKIAAQSITYGVWPFTAPELSVSVKDGVLTIKDMNAGLFGGRVGLNAAVSSGAQPRQPLHIDGRASFADIALDKTVKALSGSDLIRISGITSGDAEIKTSGLSIAALVHDLSGKGALKGQNLILSGVDVTRFARALSDESKPGDTVLGIWKGASQGGQTEFDTMDGQFDISQGIVNIKKLDLDGAKALIQTQGNVNLPNWTLSTKHMITVKPHADIPADIPPFEMSFSGSLDNPAQTFGQGLLNDYLSRRVQRKINTIISDKIGLPLGGGASQAQQQEPAAGGADGSDTAEVEDQPQKPPSVQDEAERAIRGVIGDFLR